MNYFNPYPLCIDDNITTAWKSQIAEAAKTSLAELLAQRGGELFPRFVAAYTELRALPRGARRALQRRLAHSRELSAVLQEWLQQQSSRALQQKFAATLAGAALLLVLGRGVSEANTITVNTTVAGVVADGKCSLIEAILNANADAQVSPDCPAGDPDPTEDIIALPKKTFTLTTPYVGYFGETGLPPITSQITIEGNGAKIMRKKGSPNFRLLAVSYSGNLELENLTVSGGATGPSFGGGAILNYGETTISNSTITGNSASGGGAVLNSGSLTLQNSTISKNTANDYFPNGYNYLGRGGGVFNIYGTLTVTDSTITGNKAVASGGVFNYGGNLEITGSTVSKNTALYAGGIGNYGSAPTQTITNSTISGNKANVKILRVKYLNQTYTYFIGGYGGGVTNSGNLTINNSTISGNSAKGKIVKRRYYGVPYTYLYNGRGGGIYNSGTLYLNGSTVTGNSATCYGGGIYNSGALVNTSNVSGNKAKYGPDIYP